MTILDKNTQGEISLCIGWQSFHCSHKEHFLCSSVNLWRDHFPPELEEQLLGTSEGDVVHASLGYPLCLRQESLIHQIPITRWRHDKDFFTVQQPQIGRWYPQSYLQGVSGIFRDSLQPMRIIAMDETTVTADCNHPMAGKALEVTATIGRLNSKKKERGGRCASWLDDICMDGPGMQGLVDSLRPDFINKDVMRRNDERPDNLFYSNPRLVGHIDKQASAFLTDIVARHINPEMTLLDLMAGFESHLPEGFSGKITGLGMNSQEMQSNPSIDNHLVHDLNQDPALPFPDASFDAVLCNLSFEYLLAPQSVCSEIHRILRPKGRVIISFSDRWFPPKVVRLWQILHPFERIGFVLDCLRDQFNTLSTVSYRNWPRPVDDPHLLPYSDPLFVVTAKK